MKRRKKKLKATGKGTRANGWLEALSRCSNRDTERGNLYVFQPAIEYRAKRYYWQAPDRWAMLGFDWEDIAQGIGLALLAYDSVPPMEFLGRLKGVHAKMLRTRGAVYGEPLCPLSEQMEVLEVIAKFGEASPLLVSILIAKLESVESVSVNSLLRARRGEQSIPSRTLEKYYDWIGNCLFESLPLERKIAFVFDDDPYEPVLERTRPRMVLSGLMLDV